jgi:hypothetical protein
MRLFFALVTLAVLIPSLLGLGLTWDGSYAMFLVLETQAPVASYGRLTDLVLRAPVVALSQFTASPALLQTAFTLPYAALPLLALLAAWWIVRKRAPWLMLWSALGITLAVLPGQACYVCQAVGSVQLVWPILLAVLVGLPLVTLPLVLILSLALFFFHPSAIPLFGLVAGSAGLVGWRVPERRRVLWLAALGFLVASGGAALRLLLSGTSYETGQLSPAVISRNFNTGLAALALMGLVCVGAAALVMWIAPWFVRSKLGPGLRSTLARLSAMFALACIALAGEFWFLWALMPRLWAQAIDFRSLALFSALPFMLLALGEQLVLFPALRIKHPGDRVETTALGQRRDLQSLWSYRLRVCQAGVVVVLVVISTQALVWYNLGQRLLAEMRATPGTCLSATALPWLGSTPLQHWALTTFSLLEQGRAPDHLVMLQDGCTTTSFREGLPVAIMSPGDWDLRAWQGQWFDWHALQARLTAPQNVPVCQYPLTTGWYVIEGDASNWWRWTAGDARMRVSLDRDMTVLLNGAIGSFRAPNRLDVIVNGLLAATLDLDTEPGPIAPLTLALVRGDNTIEFKSHNPPTPGVTDDRTLAIVAANLKLTTPDGAALCN